MQTTRSSSSSLTQRQCAACANLQIAEGGPSLALDSTDDPATTSLNCPSSTMCLACLPACSCASCDDGGNLLACDGPCMRSFHIGERHNNTCL